MAIAPRALRLKVAAPLFEAAAVNLTVKPGTSVGVTGRLAVCALAVPPPIPASWAAPVISTAVLSMARIRSGRDWNGASDP